MRKTINALDKIKQGMQQLEDLQGVQIQLEKIVNIVQTRQEIIKEREIIIKRILGNK